MDTRNRLKYLKGLFLKVDCDEDCTIKSIAFYPVKGMSGDVFRAGFLMPAGDEGLTDLKPSLD